MSERTTGTTPRRPDEVPILLDKPAINAALFQRQIDIATSVIKAHATDGFTMAVYGPWGSGKTTVLNGIKRSISSDSDILPIDFDAWRYDHTGNVNAMLAKEFDSTFKRLRGNDESAFDKKGLGDAVGQISWEAGSAITSSTFGPLASVLGISLMGISKLLERASDKKEAQQDDDADLLAMASELLSGDDYLKGFATIAEALAESGRSIVVFLDDLDRCDPDTIANVVSSLHVVMRQPRISFVLALDHDYLVNAITKQFEDWFPAGEEEDFADRYLEKIIQVSITVPTINTMLVGQDDLIESRNHRLFNALINEGDPSDTSGAGVSPAGTRPSMAELAMRVARYSRYGINPGAEAGTRPAQPFELFMNRIAPLALRRNPRQMKRFLNSYVLSVNAKWEYVHEDEADAIDIECDFMRLLGFRFLDPGRYAELERVVSNGQDGLGQEEGSPDDAASSDAAQEDEGAEPTLSLAIEKIRNGDKGGNKPPHDLEDYVSLTGMDQIPLIRARELFDMISTADGGGPTDGEAVTEEQKQTCRVMVQDKLIPFVRHHPELVEPLSDREQTKELIATYTGGKRLRASWPPLSVDRKASQTRNRKTYRYLKEPIRNLGPNHGTYYFSLQWYTPDVRVIDEFCEGYEREHPAAEG